jgi:hypothetical protein
VRQLNVGKDDIHQRYSRARLQSLQRASNPSPAESTRPGPSAPAQPSTLWLPPELPDEAPLPPACSPRDRPAVHRALCAPPPTRRRLSFKARQGGFIWQVPRRAGGTTQDMVADCLLVDLGADGGCQTPIQRILRRYAHLRRPRTGCVAPPQISKISRFLPVPALFPEIKCDSRDFTLPNVH